MTQKQNDSQNLLSTTMSTFTKYFESQQKTFEEILKGNQEIIMLIDDIKQKLDSFSDLNINADDDNSHGTFDMTNQTIYFNGEKYSIDNEQLCSTNQSLKEAIELFYQRKTEDQYPQGIEYCEELLKNQNQSEEMLLILTNNTPTATNWFYFKFTDYRQLSYSQTYRVWGAKLLHNHVHQIIKYKDDKYPQGYDYCKQFINDRIKKKSPLFVLARENNNAWTRYYFMSPNICPPSQNEQIYFSKGKTSLMNDLKLINESQNDNFPQGIEYCRKLFESEIAVNGQILVIGQNGNTWFYFPKNQIHLVCTAEWVIRNDVKQLQDQINVLNQRSKSDGLIFIPQGIDYCQNLIKELIKKDGTIPLNIMVRNSAQNTWFYFTYE